MKVFPKVTLQRISVFTLTAKDLHGASPKRKKHSRWSLYSLYRVYTLTAKDLNGPLLKDGSALDNYSYSLYQIFNLTAKDLHGTSPERRERS